MADDGARDEAGRGVPGPPPAQGWGPPPGQDAPQGWGPPPGQGAPQGWGATPGQGPPQGWGQPPAQGWGAPPGQGTAQGWGSPPGWGSAPAQGWGRQQRAVPQPGPVPVRPMALGDILDGAFTLYRSDVRTFLLATALLLIPVQIVAGILNVNSGFGDVLQQMQVAPASVEFDEVVETMIATLPLLLAAAAVGQVFTLLLRVGLLRVAASRYVGSSTGVNAALREGVRRLPAVLVSQLLAALLPLAPFLVVAAFAGGAFALENAALGVVAGVLALPAIVAYIFISVRLSLSLPALVVEGVGPIVALRRSWELVRGRWWPIFGTLLLAGLVLSVVTGALGGVPAIFASGSSIAVQTAVGTVTGILASLIAEPVNAIVVLLLYLDSRIRGEGLDLQLGDPQPGVDPLTGRSSPA